MSGIQLNNNREVLNRILNLIQFLVSAANEIVRVNITAVDVEECMAILDGIDILILLHVGASSDEESLFMIRSGLELKGADIDQIVDVDLVAVKLGLLFRLRGLGDIDQGVTGHSRQWAPARNICHLKSIRYSIVIIISNCQLHFSKSFLIGLFQILALQNESG